VWRIREFLRFVLRLHFEAHRDLDNTLISCWGYLLGLLGWTFHLYTRDVSLFELPFYAYAGFVVMWATVPVLLFLGIATKWLVAKLSVLVIWLFTRNKKLRQFAYDERKRKGGRKHKNDYELGRINDSLIAPDEDEYFYPDEDEDFSSSHLANHV